MALLGECVLVVHRVEKPVIDNAGYLSPVEVGGPVDIARLAAIPTAGHRGHVAGVVGRAPYRRLPSSDLSVAHKAVDAVGHGAPAISCRGQTPD